LEVCDFAYFHPSVPKKYLQIALKKKKRFFGSSFEFEKRKLFLSFLSITFKEYLTDF